MNNYIKVLITDDHSLIVEGIESMLTGVADIMIIGHAKNGNEAIEMCSSYQPDVVIMDISMPELNGIEATRRILNKHPSIKVLALTQHENYEYVVQILEAGGFGYLLKNSKKQDFINAIRAVYKGEKYFSSKITELMINNIVGESQIQNSEKKVLLTNREREIIKLVASDKNNQEISNLLHISLRTVETHRRNLMQKLNVKTVVALIRYAIKNNIITIE